MIIKLKFDYQIPPREIAFLPAESEDMGERGKDHEYLVAVDPSRVTVAQCYKAIGEEFVDDVANAVETGVKTSIDTFMLS